MDVKEIQSQVNKLLATHQYDSIKSHLLSYKSITEKNNNLATVFYLCNVYEKEKEAGIDTLFSKVSTMEELLLRHTGLKFLLRRLDFDLSDAGVDELHRFLSEYRVSSYELVMTVNFGVVHKDKVLKVIKGE